MKFVLFHGSFGRPDENWFPKLKDELESFGQVVVAPKFPVENWTDITQKGSSVSPQNQSLDNWFEAFKPIVKDFKKGEGLCFIGHSLGPLFILHVVDRFNIQLDSAIFVSPFLDKLNSQWQFDHVNSTFYKTDFDFDKLKKLIPISYAIYSDSDPYVQKQHATLFAKAMDSSFIFVKSAGHLNSEVNLNEFPLVLELCKTRIELPAYQKFISHRSKLFSVDYNGDTTEEVIYLNPKDVYGYGKFQFRNLSTSGFCTFITSNSDSDPESIYYIEARKAAKRIQNLTRVFVVSDIRDLHKNDLQKQMVLDFQAGIKLGLIMLDDIKNDVEVPDFGIWDDDYVCHVSFDNKNKANEVRLSSRKMDIRKAYEWKHCIEKEVVWISDLKKDISDFICNHS